MRPSSLLGILFDFLEEYEADGVRPADVVLSKFFKRRRYLGSHDRRFLGDGAFAWFRQRIRGELRWKLWSARHGLDLPAEGRTRHLGAFLAIAADGLFNWSLDELAPAARTFAAAAGGGWVDVLNRCVEEDFPGQKSWPEDPIDRLSAECSLPRWIGERLVAAYGHDRTRELGAALLEPAPVDLRVHLCRVEREVVRKELEDTFDVEVTVTPLSPAGLRLGGRVNLRQFLKHHPGWLEVQDEGSQLAAAAASPSPGETIIDVCAGGGGKTLALADMTGGDAVFHCCDIDASKLSELLRRAHPIGLRTVTVHGIAPEGELPQTLPRDADLVLVDAPCSGLGSLRRNPDLKLRHDEDAVADFARRQLGILDRFAHRVRRGGRLVYITCSILPDENEDVARKFLETHTDFETELPPVADRLPPETVTPKSWLRIGPTTTGTDAFFIACFRRRGADE